jgi:cell division protease FtsH
MNEKLNDKKIKFSFGYVIVAILVMTLIQRFIMGPILSKQTEIPYSEFKTALKAGEVESVAVSETSITGVMKQEDKAFYTVRVEDPNLTRELEAQGVEITGEVSQSGGVGALLGWILPLVIMGAFWYFMLKRMKGGAGAAGGLFSFGKSKARAIQGEKTGVTFKDVGGVGQAAVE